MAQNLVEKIAQKFAVNFSSPPIWAIPPKKNKVILFTFILLCLATNECDISWISTETNSNKEAAIPMLQYSAELNPGK